MPRFAPTVIAAVAPKPNAPPSSVTKSETNPAGAVPKRTFALLPLDEVIIPSFTIHLSTALAVLLQLRRPPPVLTSNGPANGQLTVRTFVVLLFSAPGLLIPESTPVKVIALL